MFCGLKFIALVRAIRVAGLGQLYQPLDKTFGLSIAIASLKRHGQAIGLDFPPAASGKSDSIAMSTTIGSIRRSPAMAAAFLRRAGGHTDLRRLPRS